MRHEARLDCADGRAAPWMRTTCAATFFLCALVSDVAVRVGQQAHLAKLGVVAVAVRHGGTAWHAMHRTLLFIGCFPHSMSSLEIQWLEKMFCLDESPLSPLCHC